MTAADTGVYRFGTFVLDLRRGCLHQGDTEIKLRPKSYAVLRHLATNAGRLVGKDELIETVWPSVVVTDESVARCVSDVRQALGDTRQELIRTVPRRGYVLVASGVLQSPTTGWTGSPTSASSAAGRPSIAVLP